MSTTTIDSLAGITGKYFRDIYGIAKVMEATLIEKDEDIAVIDVSYLADKATKAVEDGETLIYVRMKFIGTDGNIDGGEYEYKLFSGDVSSLRFLVSAEVNISTGKFLAVRDDDRVYVCDEVIWVESLKKIKEIQSSLEEHKTSIRGECPGFDMPCMIGEIPFTPETLAALGI